MIASSPVFVLPLGTSAEKSSVSWEGTDATVDASEGSTPQFHPPLTNENLMTAVERSSVHQFQVGSFEICEVHIRRPSSLMALTVAGGLTSQAACKRRCVYEGPFTTTCRCECVCVCVCVCVCDMCMCQNRFSQAVTGSLYADIMQSARTMQLQVQMHSRHVENMHSDIQLQ